jgi:hypothetical protein
MRHVDADYHMMQWIAFLQDEVYGHVLGASDYLFPALASNATVKRDVPISHDVIQEMIHKFSTDAGITLGVGKFTTHCYRRGGAQYRFMLAPSGQRWSLSMVRWWGGWAQSEQVSRQHSQFIPMVSHQITSQQH